MGHASYGNNSDQDEVPLKPDSTAAGRKTDRPGAAPAGAKDRGEEAASDLPAAGPHADRDLTNHEATPGAGTLPDAGDEDATDSTSG